MENIFSKFRLGTEKEELVEVIKNIDNGVVFRGTNLWVLIFAIFVASLGLNLNSPAIIIGAMLISPLMGPIMGIGLGIGINDVPLIRKAIYNYAVAILVALITSTVFFLISPLDEAHSEILARTSPTVYDVFIAFFGGCAGIVATSSKQKGNVIPGVAIATALMPPLCTAGYCLATLKFNYFIGAFYLFIINSVFIAWATFIVVRILHFPVRHLQNKKADNIARAIVLIIVVVTLIPSIYFGYDIVQRDRFSRNANRFINNETNIPNDYLLNRKVDARAKKITLVFGGREISETEISNLRSQLKKYDLQDATLEINQGFAYFSGSNEKESDEQTQLTQALAAREIKLNELQKMSDSLDHISKLTNSVYKEIKAQYPQVSSASIQPSRTLTDTSINKTVIVLLTVKGRLSSTERKKLGNWLAVRMEEPNIKLIVQ